MQLAPASFNRLIGHLGQAALWRPSQLCPCRDPYSGAADPGCAACHGRGVFWRAPIRCKVGLTGLKVAREWRDFGMWEDGDVVLTLPSDSPVYAAAENDQIILTDSSVPWAETHTRGAPDERWPAYLVKAEAIAVLEAGVPVAAGVPRLPPTETGGPPAWGDATRPAIGQQYSVRGRRRPIYYVFRQLPQDRAHHGGLTLPRRVSVRSFDLFGR